MNVYKLHYFDKVDTDCIDWCLPQGAVVVLAKDSHKQHVSTKPGVERSLFGLPCQDSTAREREEM